MALTEQEIESQVGKLMDEGFSDEEIATFVDKARAESAPSQETASEPIEPGKPGGMSRREWRKLPIGTKGCGSGKIR